MSPLPFHDLAVSHAALEPQTQRERVSHAIKLGWDAVVLVHQAAARLSEQADRCAFRPVELQALLTASAGMRKALEAAEQRGSHRHGDPYSVRQLTRINIPADDAATAQACAPRVAYAWQVPALLCAPPPPTPPPTPPHPSRPCPSSPCRRHAAVRWPGATIWWPSSPAASACFSLPAHRSTSTSSLWTSPAACPTASNPRSSRLHWPGECTLRCVLLGRVRRMCSCGTPGSPSILPHPLQICYAPVLREAGLRRQLFANALALCRETRGRGIVLSSGARSYMELRGPLDVANLATLFGLTQEQALAALTSAPAAAVQRAAARRAYRSTLTVRVRTVEEAAVARQQEQARQQAAQQDERMQVDAGSPAAAQQPLSFARAAGR